MSELELSTLEKIRDIAWTAPTWGGFDSGEGHYHVRCAGSRIYLVDATWEPGLWFVDVSAQDPEAVEVPEVTGVGDLVLTEDGSQLYYVQRVGWSAGFAGSDISRVEVDTWALLDETGMGYPGLSVTRSMPPWCSMPTAR